ncbi:MAG: hypothetical protein IJN42_04930 [Clostridia bacterium]|nr:hypothetical protein [Clostridia bacterium]
MKHLFIFNPNSIKGKKGEKLLQRIREKCKDLNFEIYLSASGEDARNKARETCKAGEEICVYAGGGDGLIHQVAQAIYGFQNAILSVIPVGTGNDFVRNFGGKERFLTLDHITDSEERTIDLFRAGEYIGANMINIGFDASVVTRLEKLRKWPLMSHSIAYTIALVIQLVQYPRGQLHIKAKDIMLRDRFLLTFIANGQYCGGGYRSASKAKLDDGLLDVFQVKPVSRAKFLSLVGSYKKGTLLDKPQHKHIYHFFQTDRLSLHSETPFDMCLDGEMITCADVEIEVLKNAMRVRVPKGEKQC